MQYQILDENGSVINTIAATEAFVAAHFPGKYKAVEVPAQLPELPPAIPKETRITQLAFRKRFTDAEKRRMYEAAKSNVDVQIYIDDLKAATNGVSLSDPLTVDGINALGQLGILDTADRAAQILTAPIQPSELLDS